MDERTSFKSTDVCKFCGINRDAFDRTTAPCNQLMYPHTFRAAEPTDLAPLSLRELRLLHALLGPLEDMEVITLDPDRAQKCCGLDRDEQGRCVHRPGHPIYVRIPEEF